MSEPVVVTIGYEGRTVDELIDLLTSEEVEVLVDVRLNAMSRKQGFSKRRLGEAIAIAGIEYVHEPRLGNPKENRAGFQANDPTSRESYLARLNGESRPAFDAIVELALDRPIALMCYEADHHICHRTCISVQMHAEHPDLRVIDL